MVRILVLVGGTALLIEFFWYFGLFQYLSPDFLHTHIENFGLFAPIFFVLVCIIATLLLIPPTPFTILGGYLFGFFGGVILAILAQSIALVLAFLFARHLLGDHVSELLGRKFPKIYTYDQKLERWGFQTVLLTRLIAFFPFGGLNYVFGLTRVPLREYFLGSIVGIFPPVVIFVYFGHSLARASVWQIVVSSVMLVIFGITALFLERLWKRRGERSSVLQKKE